MNLRDYIFKILKEQTFFKDVYSCDQNIAAPEERKKLKYFIDNSELPKNEICELAVGDPTHDIFDARAEAFEIGNDRLVFLDAMI